MRISRTIFFNDTVDNPNSKTTIEAGAVLGCISIDMKDGKRVPQTGDLLIGRNVFIGANATIHRGKDKDTPTIIGDNVVIAAGASIGHGVILQDNVIVLGMAQISGHVLVKKGAEIGPGAQVRNRVVIGENALVGQGAVVTKDVPANEVWVGNPARFLKQNDKQLKWVERRETDDIKDALKAGESIDSYIEEYVPQAELEIWRAEQYDEARRTR